jgi:hypothetical protein
MSWRETMIAAVIAVLLAALGTTVIRVVMELMGF